jgi:hypothetical protein
MGTERVETAIDILRMRSVTAAYKETMQRIVFLCFSGGELNDIEREAIAVTDYASAVESAGTVEEIKDLMAKREAK